MTRLRIELNTNIEIVTSNVIHKLYEIASEIIDHEEANQIATSLVYLKGNLLVAKAYGDEANWLTTKFQDLNINITTASYISFDDPYALKWWANTPIGDGIGVILADMQSITNDVSKEYFGSDNGTQPFQQDILSLVTSLISLKYTNVSQFNSYRTYLKQYAPNLKRIAFPASTTLVNTNFFDFPDLEYIDSSLCDNCTVFAVTDCPKLEEAHIPPLVDGFYGMFIRCSAMKDVFVYGSPNLSATSLYAFDNTPVFNMWVNDSEYSNWTTYLNNVGKSNKVVLKRFSEYTGNNLIQKWITPSEP